MPFISSTGILCVSFGLDLLKGELEEEDAVQISVSSRSYLKGKERSAGSHRKGARLEIKKYPMQFLGVYEVRNQIRDVMI